MTAQRIFLTGGSGFLGRALQKRLSAVHVWAPTRAELDLAADWGELEPPFPIDVVVHAAASRERNEAGPHRYPEEVRINVDGAARLYEWARAKGVPAIVHVSTISVLEPSTDLSDRIDEDAPLDLPPHPYALTKRWGEELAAALQDSFEAVAIVRPGMMYGPDSPARASVTRMAAAARGEETRRIPAPRGNVFAPVFVDDVADVIARLALAPRDAVVNVGGPDAVHELDMLRALAAHFGTTPRVELDPEAEPVAMAPSTEQVDALFPTRIKTPWLVGLARAFPKPAST